MNSSSFQQKQSCYIEDSWRNFGLLLLLVALFIAIGNICFYLHEGVLDSGNLRSYMFWWIPAGAIGWGGILLIRRGDVWLEWDDAVLRRRGWFKRTVAIPWSALTDLEVRYHDGQPCYTLYEGLDARFRIDFRMIPDAHGLEGWLQGKLEPLYLKAIGAEELKLPFTSFASELGRGTLILEEDRIVMARRYEETAFSYDEVKVVLIESAPASSSRYTLCDGDRECCSFDSLYYQFPRLLFLLRSRLKSVLWVDLTSSTPPADPRAAEIYHQRRVAESRNRVLKKAFFPKNRSGNFISGA